MYSKQILANGFTVKRFVIQTVLIFLLSGILLASMAVFDLDLRLFVRLLFLCGNRIILDNLNYTFTFQAVLGVGSFKHSCRANTVYSLKKLLLFSD